MTLQEEQGQRFKTYINGKFETLIEAGKFLGIPETTFHRYFSGAQAIGKRLKEKISEALGEEVLRFILTGEKPKQRIIRIVGERIAEYKLPRQSIERVVVNTRQEGDAIIIEVSEVLMEDPLPYADGTYPLDDLEDFGRAAATPKQPPSGRAFQEGQEP